MMLCYRPLIDDDHGAIFQCVIQSEPSDPSPCDREKVRVLVSRARGAHVACAIPRAAFGINHVKPLKGFTLPTINRWGLRLLIPKHSRSLSLSRERASAPGARG